MQINQSFNSKYELILKLKEQLLLILLNGITQRNI